jgi:hypothetical protein
MAHILTKLGTPSRSAAVAVAVRRSHETIRAVVRQQHSATG